MKTSVATTTLAILLGISSTASAASCVRQANIVATYIVKANGVPDVPGICGGLWDNLKRFSSCVGLSNNGCGNDGVDLHNLVWKFDVGLGCNAGDVESAWWEATRNNYGSIAC
ncbi:hypothetical protein F4803DRAFT_506382 [Xylaria telfairii]|nr:hypothetical protein F4803DRAFT_506382 [Xylaria telfairii]